jgi:hypothetical protein
MLSAIARFEKSPPRSVIVGLLSGQGSGQGSAMTNYDTVSTPESLVQLF